jgi:hypothetical protein
MAEELVTGIARPEPVILDELVPANVDTISPKVYGIASITTSGSEKAQLLTDLFKSILDYGVFRSVEEAYIKGIPEGALVVIDDPETPEVEFNIQVVKEVYKKDNFK